MEESTIQAAASIPWERIILSIAGSGGLIYAFIHVFKAIGERLDVYRARKQARRELDLSTSADLRRIKLEEDRLDESVWEAVAKEKQLQINAKEVEILEFKAMIRKAKQSFDGLDTMFRRLRIAKIPDEVVELLSEKIERAREEIKKGRDALG